MRTNTYKLANVARPGQYVSLANGKIVGHSDQPGVMIEWFVMFHEGGLATFQAVRKGENPWLFLVRESSSSNFYSIEIEGTDDWAWKLASWDENSPIETESNTGSTQQLWAFEMSGSM